MTSNNNDLDLSPVFAPEVQSAMQSGYFKIGPLVGVEYELFQGDKNTAKAVRLKCQGLLVKKPAEIHRCNAVVKTHILGGSGTHTDIVACPKCRTAYIIKINYEDGDTPTITSRVWDVARNVSHFCVVERDGDDNAWCNFNTSDKPRKK